MKKFILIFLVGSLCCIQTVLGYDISSFRGEDRNKQLDSFLNSKNIYSKDSATVYELLSDIARDAEAEADSELINLITVMKAWYDFKSRSLDSNDYRALVKTIPQIKDDITLLKAHLLAGVFCEYQNDIERAFSYMIRYAYLLDNISYKDYTDKMHYLYHLGSLYYYFLNYDVAEFYLKQVDDIALATTGELNITTNNTIGLIKRAKEKYDSALYYFERAAKAAQKNNDDWWINILKGNIGITYYHQGKYADAMPLLYSDMNYAVKNNHIGGITNTILKISRIHLARNDVDSSLYYVILAQKLTSSAVDAYKHREEAYRILREIALKNNDESLALMYSDSIILVKDSLTYLNRGLKVAHTQLLSEHDKHIKELALVRSETEKQSTSKNIIVGIFSVALLGGVFYIGRLRIRQKKLRIEKTYSDNALLDAKKSLQTYETQLKQRTQEIDGLQMQLKLLEFNPLDNSQDITDHKERISELQQSVILTDEDWQKFKDLFETVHPGYIHALKKQFPELSESECRFMTLSKLKLSNKEKAAILGIGLSGIRNYKYRIIKKLNLPSDTSVSDFADTIHAS